MLVGVAQFQGRERLNDHNLRGGAKRFCTKTGAYTVVFDL